MFTGCGLTVGAGVLAVTVSIGFSSDVVVGTDSEVDVDGVALGLIIVESVVSFGTFEVAMASSTFGLDVSSFKMGVPDPLSDGDDSSLVVTFAGLALLVAFCNSSARNEYSEIFDQR